MRLSISALSRSGRREPNEDAYGCWSARSASFCCVSDGAGGHGGGEVASKVAVKVTLAHFQSAPVCSAETMHGALSSAHRAILALQKSGAHLAHMRATAVVLAVDSARRHACWAHLGDTRLYCFRDGDVLDRTRDHSVVQRMIDAGYLPETDVRTSPERSRLFAALGQEQNFLPQAHWPPLPLLPGDAFLLCTDGLWGGVDDAVMLGTLRTARSTEQWLALMEKELLARADPDQDNYSAIALWCGDDDEVGRGSMAGASR